MRLSRCALQLLAPAALLACGDSQPGAAPPKASPDTETREAAPSHEPVASEPTRPEAFVPRTPADYVGKHVLVRSGAHFRVAPSDAASAATMRTSEDDPASASATMEVVDASGEFIAVRPAARGNSCTAAVPGLRAFDLKLWVRPSDLAPVLGLRTPVEREGDSAVVWPGAPVVVDGAATTVNIGGTTLAVQLDPAVITTAFEPEPQPLVDGGSVVFDDGPSLTWGGAALDEAALLGTFLGRQPPGVLREGPNGKRTAIVWTRCAHLTARVPRSRTTSVWVDGPPRVGGTLARAVALDAHYEVGSGATVFARDGSRIGTATATHEFSGEPRAVKRRRCFDLALAEPAVGRPTPEETLLEVCFDKSAVHDTAPPLATVLPRAPAKLPILRSTLESKGLIAELGGDHDSGGLFEPEGPPGGSTTGSAPKAAELQRRVVRAHRREAQACYEKLLRTKPGASGNLSVELTIDGSGKVTATKVNRDSVAGGVAKCVTKSASTWKFPAGSAGSVEFSFVFTSM
ncbi:MAG: AgmX/PglI C-terminal domain-containing protein [Myxococcota bacterium]